jgi:hypothetical protein
MNFLTVPRNSFTEPDKDMTGDQLEVAVQFTNELVMKLGVLRLAPSPADIKAITPLFCLPAQARAAGQMANSRRYEVRWTERSDREGSGLLEPDRHGTTAHVLWQIQSSATIFPTAGGRSQVHNIETKRECEWPRRGRREALFTMGPCRRMILVQMPILHHHYLFTSTNQKIQRNTPVKAAQDERPQSKQGQLIHGRSSFNAIRFSQR